MHAKQLLDEGRLDAAIDALTAEVRDRPDDRMRRTFLFELLGFAGRWDRARRQLDALEAGDDPQSLLGTQLIKGLLDAESKRAEVFAKGLRPRFLLDPPESARLHLEALALARDGRESGVRAALDRAEAARPPSRGRAGDTPFDDVRDADDRLGPVLEVLVPAGYFWVPWEQIQFLEVSPPASLRDLLWLPAKLATWDGQLGEVHLPGLYPGSAEHPDEAVRLGRKTEWVEDESGLVRGAGLKLLLVGDEARALPDLGVLHFEPHLPTGDAADAGPGD